MGVVERDTAWEFGLRLWPLPIVEPQHGGHRRVGFTEIRVEAKGRQRGGFGFGEGALWREVTVPAEENVGIGDAGIGESVSGILFNGLLKVFDGFVEAVFGPLVPVMATFQVETVGLVIISLMFGQAFFFGAGEFQF